MLFLYVLLSVGFSTAMRGDLNHTGNNYAYDRLKFLRCWQKFVNNSLSACHLTIEGKLGQHHSGGYRACTVVGDPYWWVVYMQHFAFVHEVRILTSYDKVINLIPEQLQGLTVEVDHALCINYSAFDTAIRSKTVGCKLYGRFLHITANRTTPLPTLCEIKAYGYYLDSLNLGNCSQSSTYNSSSGHHPCNLAYDVWRHDIWNCTHLDFEPSGWWKAQTEQFARIILVRIWNHSKHRNRLNDFTISVDGTVCASHKSNITFLINDFACHAFGRTVEIKSNLPYMTLCEVKVYGETELCREVLVGSRRFCTFQQRLDESANFNKSWADYVNGFGDERNFWTGLAWLHRMTSKPGNVIFRAELTTWKNETYVAEYSGFVVRNASTNYTMDYVTFLRNASTVEIDSLKDSKNQQFFTIDRYHERDPGFSRSKAGYGGGGWWFGRNGSNVNLNGVIKSVNSTTYLDGCAWWFGRNIDVPLRATRLLIRVYGRVPL